MQAIEKSAEVYYLVGWQPLFDFCQPRVRQLRKCKVPSSAYAETLINSAKTSGTESLAVV